MAAKKWRAVVAKGVTVAKPVHTAHLALCQACVERRVSGISASPALPTAINKEIAELPWRHNIDQPNRPAQAVRGTRQSEGQGTPGSPTTAEAAVTDHELR